MVYKGRIFTLAAIATMLFLYQNCEHRDDLRPSEDPLVVKIGEEIHVFSELSPAVRLEVCHDSRYVCTERTFAPGLAYSSASAEGCADVTTPGGTRRICFDHRNFTYDSAAALAACPDCGPADGEPGGRYNYREIKCHHPELQTLVSQEFPVARETADLGESLAQAVEACEGAGAP